MSAIFSELIYDSVWPLAYVWVLDYVRNQFFELIHEEEFMEIFDFTKEWSW